MIRGSIVGVSCVRAQEAKDAVVKLSVLVVIDFGDGAVLANNNLFQQMALIIIAEVNYMQGITHRNYEVTERK